MSKSSPSANLPVFQKNKNGSPMIRGTLISLAGTGLWETYSFICLNGQLKAELTVSRTLCPEP